MFNYHDLVIDIDKSFGSDYRLKSIRAKYAYVNGEKTSTVEGYIYNIVLIARGYEDLNVSIPGECKVDAETVLKHPKVAFVGMKVSLYSHNGIPAVSVKADDIRVIA